METKHEIEFEAIAPIWRTLGFQDRDVMEVSITPVDMTVTTFHQPDADDRRSALCHCPVCEERGSHLAIVAHSYRVSYTEHEKAKKELAEAMAADADAFKNVELT